MLHSFTLFALPLAFALFAACALLALVSGLALMLFNLRQTNQALRHPFLRQRAFASYPIPVRLAILLDYFFRLAFPRCKVGLIGNANKLLSHVQPNDIPMTIKWPLYGLWGGCFVGIAAMLTVWILVVIN